MKKLKINLKKTVVRGNKQMKELEVELTDEQLDAIIKKRNAQKKEQEARKQFEYETLREEIVVSAVEQAKHLHSVLKFGHKEIIADLLSFRELMIENNDLRKNSLGGFSLQSKDDTMKVSLKVKSIGEFDERADMAEVHIRDFFERRLKTNDPQVFEQLMELLERKKGKFEYSRVMKILQNEGLYDDEAWKKGCSLFKESFHVTSSKVYVELAEKDEMGNWQAINLNFSSFDYEEDVRLKKEEKA